MKSIQLSRHYKYGLRFVLRRNHLLMTSSWTSLLSINYFCANSLAAAFVLQIPPCCETLIIGEISWTAVRFMPANKWKVCFIDSLLWISKRDLVKNDACFYTLETWQLGEKTLSSPSCPNKRPSTHWAEMQRVLRPRHMTCIMETYCIEIVCARIPGMEKNGALWSAPWGLELPECAQTDCKASFTSR